MPDTTASNTAFTPVQSRQVVSPTMALRGLKSAAELAANKPCGTRVKYYAGCRCLACRRSNTDYERERQAARKRGESNRLVSAEPARKHLVWLSAQGVGRKTAADASKVAHSIISRIVDGEKLRIREQTERRILAVTTDAAADRAYIDGTETWRMLEELIASGYSKARIGSEVLGKPVPALQIKPGRVTVRNADRVRRAYERMRYSTKAQTIEATQLVQDMRDEGFRLDRILRELEQLAGKKGLPTPNLQPAKKGDRIGCLRAFEVDLVRAVHVALTEVPE